MALEQTQVPIKIWAVVLSLVTVLILSAKLYSYYSSSSMALSSFAVDRLATSGDNSVVIIGTSLVRFALPFDQELTDIATRHGLPFTFVRFTHPGNNPEPFFVLMQPLLEHPPRYLFLHAEPMVLMIVPKADGEQFTQFSPLHLRFIHDSFHELYILCRQWFSSRSVRHYNDQSDDRIRKRLSKVATKEIITQPERIPVIASDSLPAQMQSFIEQIQKKGTKVVLLETNRSREGNLAMGPAFRERLTQTFRHISERHSIAYWQFPAQTFRYYRDRAHLNQYGRDKFTTWFLARLKHDYDNDRF